MSLWYYHRDVILCIVKYHTDVIVSRLCDSITQTWFGPNWLIFNNNSIERVNTHRHLGVYLSSSLDWTVQVNDVCLKASKKLSVLRNVKFLKRNTLDLLYKITVRSVIDYALPVYANNLKLTELARFDRLQYKAGKLVSGALHYTSRAKLNNELGWENFQQRIKFLGLCLFQKIHLHETRPLVRSCMSKLDYEKKYLTWSLSI